MRLLLLTICLSFFIIAGIAQAQVLPLERTGSLIVADSGQDFIWRLTDFNHDGDYNDPGEALEFYDPSLGGVPLGNPSAISSDSSGYIYVADSTSEMIIRLHDSDSDGTANTFGEATVFFDNTNLSGIALSSPNYIAITKDGGMYISNAGDGGNPSTDNIIYCYDANKNGTANDAGEATIYYDPFNVFPGLPVFTLPSVVQVQETSGVDIVYCMDFSADAIYRLEDLSVPPDGDAIDAGEVTVWYDGTGGGPGLGSVWSFIFASDGGVFISDSSYDRILLGYDNNPANGSLDDPNEVIIWRDQGPWPYDPAYPNIEWPYNCTNIAISSAPIAGTLEADFDHYIFGADRGSSSKAPDAVLRIQDINSNGTADDPGELYPAYYQNFSLNHIDSTKGVGFMKGPSLLQEGKAEPTKKVDIKLSAVYEDLFFLFLSPIKLDPLILLPNHGYAAIGIPYFMIDFGAIPDTGENVTTIKIPKNVKVGTEFYFQALAGSGYLTLLSNRLAMIIE